MRILLVEDDRETLDYVGTALRTEGHFVEPAVTGPDGLHLATESPFDVMIVDRMIPGIDGLALVRAARAAGVTTPALLLTAIGAVADRVAGLEAGADDYLVKPFAFAELRARIAALARRPPIREEPTLLEVADLRLDRLSRRVTRGRSTVELQPREFRILEELMLNAGRIVTRTMLLERIWEFNFDPGTNIVETHISRIRTKIEREGGASLIHTVRGAGYVIRAD
jgi:two-component system, OmpR family, response regulator